MDATNKNEDASKSISYLPEFLVYVPEVSSWLFEFQGDDETEYLNADEQPQFTTEQIADQSFETPRLPQPQTAINTNFGSAVQGYQTLPSVQQYENQPLTPAPTDPPAQFVSAQQVAQPQAPPVVSQAQTIAQQQPNPAMQGVLIPNKATQNERHYHHRMPMVEDNAEWCITYYVKSSNDIAQRDTAKDYTQISRNLMSNHKSDVVDIARLYIFHADDCGEMIRLELQYINANEVRLSKTIYVTKEDCKQYRLCDVLMKEGIGCFNPEISKRKVSEYLYQLIFTKMSGQKYDFPEQCGFEELNGQWCFVTEEYCKEQKYPVVTDKSFSMALEDGITSENMEKSFCDMVQLHHSPKQFLLLNMLRIMGLLTTPISQCELLFPKIVFINGNGEKLAKYLQVYDREDETARPCSINIPIRDLEGIFKVQKDCVMILEDKEDTSTFQKKNGLSAIEFLSNMIFDHVNTSYWDTMYLTVVFSPRLSQLMPSEKALVIDLSDFSCDASVSNWSVRLNCYYLDRLIVNRICNDMTDFQNCIYQNRKHYEAIAQEQGVDIDTFTCLMLVYHEMLRQFRSLQKIVSEQVMADYLVEILKKSDESYNGGSIADEFRNRLNQMILNDEMELVLNSDLNSSYGASGKKPVIFYDDQWMYFTPEVFEIMIRKVTLANTANAIRKALEEQGWLRYFDSLTYKVKLHDKHYNGNVNVTAVSFDILTDEAKQKRRGGRFNYTPCTDDTKIERIPLGTDEHGRTVYWSLGHKYIGNTHMMINGRSGTGKSTTVNLLVKELYSRKHHIVYVDFSHSDTPEKLAMSGLDAEFQKDHIFRAQISECLESDDDFEMAIMFMTEEDKILIFEAPIYSKSVEEFLEKLYNRVASDSTLSIFVVIDEAHLLRYQKDSAMYKIAEIGRSNGISLISIIQGPHQMKRSQYSIFNQAEVKLIFKSASQDDAKKIADENHLKPSGKFADLIGNLKKCSCLVVGNLESDDGELSDGRFIEITIPNIESSNK